MGDTCLTSKGITADKLQSLVLRLSNQCYVRHWLHYNYPEESPWLMAIALHNHPNFSILEEELTAIGFRNPDNREPIYTIERVDEKGNPFKVGTVVKPEPPQYIHYQYVPGMSKRY